MRIGFWIESLLRLSEMHMQYRHFVEDAEDTHDGLLDMGGEPWVYIQVR